MEVKLHRVDYMQVGLTCKNTLKILDSGLFENNEITVVTAVVGDQAGSVQCFSVRSDSSHVETSHHASPSVNGKVYCLEVVGGATGSPKILTALQSMHIRGYTRKGKNFFGLELNNLTEPLKFMKFRWPNEIFVGGNYMYNHFVINADNSASGDKATIIQSKNVYVCPEVMTAMILLEDKTKRRSVAVIATKDRLIRLIRESNCEFEIETTGIPTALVNIVNLTLSKETYFCYGCSDGKVSMVGVDFNQKPSIPQHKWEIPERGTRAPVECMASADSGNELVIGRADGAVEIWSFSGSLDIEGEQTIDLDNAPIQCAIFNCGESLTSVAATREGQFLMCCTFTGIVFGLSRNDITSQKLNPNYLVIGKDTIHKIETLRAECDALEARLAAERVRYQDSTANSQNASRPQKKESVALSTLPYFAINDSFILQEDASYLLSLEVEVAIDAVIVQSDIPLDLIDCERNSAVVSFSETFSPEVLATFRCQSNTTRLEIKIRSVEGQYGILRIYIMMRMTPKSCQVKHYQIKPLSLHKRSYNVTSEESKSFLSKLTITGNFSKNEGHNWLQQCLPEVPEKVASGGAAITYNFVSTFCDTLLICEFQKGSIIFYSDNVSTVSIVKDFVTREATKKSIMIEMTVNINEASLNHMLRKIYPKIFTLVRKKHNDRLSEAIKELNATDPEVAAAMLEDLKREDEQESGPTSSLNLERLYGLITDLFIDHHKLKGSATRATLNSIRSKIGDLIILIEACIAENDTRDAFVEKINQFWGLPPP